MGPSGLRSRERFGPLAPFCLPALLAPREAVETRLLISFLPLTFYLLPALSTLYIPPYFFYPVRSPEGRKYPLSPPLASFGSSCCLVAGLGLVWREWLS